VVARGEAVSSTQGRGCCIGLKQEGGGGRGEAWETRGRRLCVSVGEEGGKGRGWNSGRDRGEGIISMGSRSQVSVLIINQSRWEREF